MAHRLTCSTLGLFFCAMLATGCVVYASPSNEAPPPPRPRHQPPPPPRRPPPRQPAQGRVVAPPPATPPAQPPPQPTREEPPATLAAAITLPAGIGAGRPAGFRPGADAAYWIWQGPRGGWRIKTTTKQMPHVFRGRFDTVTGTVSSVEASRNEFRDQVWKVRDGWAFHLKTQGHADGLTFSASDNGCVRFDLQVDGGPHKKRIFVGKSEHEPASNHFVVCPKGMQPPPTQRPRAPERPQPRRR